MEGPPGIWRFLNWLQPDYQQHIEHLTKEVLGRYGREVDGPFYDILLRPKGAGWSPASRVFRDRHGLRDNSDAGFERFLAKAQGEFATRFPQVIHAMRPEATVFYNAGSDSFLEPGLGARSRYGATTHMEFKSLPSEFWGYHHFPRLARYTGNWGKPWLAMTGRFQAMWGDFVGLKSQAALEFEYFRPQALVGANSVGDQLPPWGRLERAAYDWIGAVFSQVAAAEPFYEGSTSIATSGKPGLDANETAKSDEGAIQMCEEAHYECRLLDGHDTLDDLDLVILGDSTTPTPAFVAKLRALHASGGRILA